MQPAALPPNRMAEDLTSDARFLVGRELRPGSPRGDFEIHRAGIFSVALKAQSHPRWESANSQRSPVPTAR